MYFSSWDNIIFVIWVFRNFGGQISKTFEINKSCISSFLSNRRLRVVLDGETSQEYPVNAGVPQGSIPGPALFLLYINDLPDDVIRNIPIYTDDTTPYFKCDQASDLW